MLIVLLSMAKYEINNYYFYYTTVMDIGGTAAAAAAADLSTAVTAAAGVAPPMVYRPESWADFTVGVPWCGGGWWHCEPFVMYTTPRDPSQICHDSRWWNGRDGGGERTVYGQAVTAE